MNNIRITNAVNEKELEAVCFSLFYRRGLPHISSRAFPQLQAGMLSMSLSCLLLLTSCQIRQFVIYIRRGIRLRAY